MLTISKPDKLGIAIIMILIAHETELAEICCIKPKMNFISLDDFYGRRLFEVEVK